MTLRGSHERPSDIVHYLNGTAIAVLELKRSRTSIGDGIRQSISNQRPEFNEWFFRTIQLILAGNDSEGLRDGTIGTEEKYFLKWKEHEADDWRFRLDKYLLKMAAKIGSSSSFTTSFSSTPGSKSPRGYTSTSP